MRPRLTRAPDGNERRAASITRSARLAALVIGCCVSCTITNTEAPAISGPSELGLAIALHATPDVLPWDGMSAAVVTILARDAYARPVAALGLTAETMVDGVVQEFGWLSARSLTTDNEGGASVTYRAPESVLGDTRQSIVTVVITASTGDARAEVAHTVDIRLVPPYVADTGR
jgi:hypothetical protein